MSAGRIVTGDEINADLALSCDVCVVGSGSGGGWLAHELVARGLDVILLEEGSYRTRRDFDLTEATANRYLYQELGGRTTEDLGVNILQGRCVGGGTTVNWCSSFRTPRKILELWRDRHGVEGLSEAALAPHFEAIEKRLHIAEWPLAQINRNNRVLWDGLGKLGYQRGLIRRNVHNCANLGYCGLGCPLDAKMGTLVTVIPDAVEGGMRLYANASVRRLETSGRRVTAVHVEVLDPEKDAPTGRRLVVRPKVTAVCAGAINSPALLLRSELTGGGRVGLRTFIHPVVLMVAEFDEPIEGYAGAPQSVYSHHFIDRGERMGFFLEVAPTYPLAAAATSTAFGTRHQALMERLPHLQASFAGGLDGALDGDEGGRVALHPDSARRVRVSYPFGPLQAEMYRTACKELAKLQLAAGARRVHSLHHEPVELTSVADLPKLDAAPWENLRLRVVTAHLMGGCTMGRDPAKSVVDSRLRYHTLDNLFVVDGSALPTGLGVNPQLTIFGLARFGAQHVAAAV
ncbi:MAG: GMC family oxidoreductase [Deltaproteobacteria bacterium]|nr:GMC family oxidoreductase [Deltaproteobacteria bacterium]